MRHARAARGLATRAAARATSTRTATTAPPSSAAAATAREPCAVQPRDVAIIARRLALQVPHRTAAARAVVAAALASRPPTAACSSSSAPATSSASGRSRAAAPTPGPTTSAQKATASSSTPGLIGPRERYQPARGLRLRARPARAPAQRLGARLPPRRSDAPCSPGTARRTSNRRPRPARPQLRLDDDWSAEDLRDPRARPVRPDAVLEIAGDDGDAAADCSSSSTTAPDASTRTTTSSAATTPSCAGGGATPPTPTTDQPPFVLFICQDEAQRGAVPRPPPTASSPATAGTPARRPERHDYVGRRRILFALEHDAHDGVLEAWRLPAFPPGHPARTAEVRRVALSPVAAKPSKTLTPPPTRGDQARITVNRGREFGHGDGTS